MKKTAEIFSKLIVAVYFFLIFYFQIFVDVTTFPNGILVISLLCLSLLLVFACDRLLKAMSQYIRRHDTQTNHKKRLAICFLITFAVCEAALLLYWFSYLSGHGYPDTHGQLEQAVSGKYSDWHPFLHTILFFTLPLKIFGTSTVTIPIQITLLSCAMAYVSLTLRRYNCPYLVIILWLFIALASPLAGDLMVDPLKDSAMAVFAVALTGQYINIVLSKGKWIKKPLNAILFIVLLVLTTMMRHNAILFCFPLVLSVFVLVPMERKRVVISAALYLVAVLLVKFPMAQALHVSKPEGRLSETTGLSMVMMGNVLKEAPYSLDPEVKDYLLSVSDKDVWEKEYVTGDFNYVKWHSRTDREALEKPGLKKLLEYSWETFKAEPRISLKAILSVTSMVWRIDGNIPWKIGGEPQDAFPDKWAERIRNKSHTQEISSFIARLCQKITSASSHVLRQWYDVVEHSSALKSILYCFGWSSVTLIGASLLNIKKWQHFSKILLALPVLCYNFGTAVFLTGYDWRYFCYSLFVTIPILFAILVTGENMG